MVSGKRLGKSGIVRASLHLLAKLSDADFAKAIEQIEEVKRGPRK